MFKILDKAIRTGIVTKTYPEGAAMPPAGFRGAPAFDLAK